MMNKHPSYMLMAVRDGEEVHLEPWLTWAHRLRVTKTGKPKPPPGSTSHPARLVVGRHGHRGHDGRRPWPWRSVPIVSRPAETLRAIQRSFRSWPWLSSAGQAANVDLIASLSLPAPRGLARRAEEASV